MNKDYSNTELIERLKKGDIDAFDLIYNKYCNKLHKFVLRYLKQEEDAQEIVQEVFIKIWESRSKINTFSSFESFLFTIAYNASISLLRKRINEEKSREYIKFFPQIEQADKIINDIHFQELNQKVLLLLEQLTPRQKEIYSLSREEGLTHKQIAQKLNLSENTVKNHLVTILKFLKSNLDSGLIINALFINLFFL